MIDGDEYTLPEYSRNPFISKMPRLLSRSELKSRLIRLPEFDVREKGFPSHLRRHCIMRLSRYHEPMDRQIILGEKFDIAVRQGYIGRDPSTHDYVRQLQNGAQRVDAKDLDIAVQHPIENTAISFALVGCSGSGKSTSFERILHGYPQCIVHTTPFSLIQIVWIKLECPSVGSPKQLCISFFKAVDSLVGTNYFHLYGKGLVEEMMAHMAQVATLHAIGALIIDEIQHLNKAKIGPDGVLNFMVRLVNTVGIPVILIGTPACLRLLQGNFRQARRGNGLGSLLWDPLPRGNVWDHFVEKIWEYQWTREHTPLTPEIKEALYDLSQGIIDILVTLFMMAQMRAISIGEARKKPETLSAGLLRKVAKDDFKIIEPMISALRRGDKDALTKYDDLLPFHDHIQQIFSTAHPHSEEAAVAQSQENLSATSQNGDEQIMTALRSLGIASDVAKVLIDEADLENPSDDPLLKIASITNKLTGAIKKRKANPAKKEKAAEIMPIDDLRHITKEGEKTGVSGYEALLAAKVVAPPPVIFAQSRH